MGNSAWRVGLSAMRTRWRRSACCGPAEGALHALAGVLVSDGIFGTLVERHADIAAEGQLHVDGGFRGEGVEIAIEVRLENHALIGDLPQAAEAEDLEAAGIGENCVGPGHEAVQSAHFADELVAGAQEKMIGVGEEDLDAEVLGEVALAESFDGGLRSHRHEYRGFDGPVRGVEQSSPRAGLWAFGHELEGDLGQIRL